MDIIELLNRKLDVMIKQLDTLGRAISTQYSSLNTAFSGIDNKISDYSIFTLIERKMTDYKINMTFPRANFITTMISDSTSKINIGVNSPSKQKLAYIDGSNFKGVISNVYITYDFTNLDDMPKAEIYIGYNSEFKPITTVKIEGVDTQNSLPVTVVNQAESADKKYELNAQSGTLNNEISSFTINKKTNSITIKNTSSTSSLYFGNITSQSDFTQALEILAGESLVIDFNPLCSLYTFNLATASGETATYSILYNEVSDLII